MLSLLFIPLFAVVLGASRQTYGRWLNIVSLFTALWTMTALMSSIGLFSLRIPSDIVYAYCLLFVVVFDTSVLLFSRKRDSSSRSSAQGVSTTKEYILPGSDGLNLKAIKWIQIITVLLCIPLFIQALQVFVMTFDLSAVRNSYYGSQLSETQMMLFRNLPNGLITGLIIVYIVQYFFSKKTVYLWLGIANAVLSLFTNGGRYSLLSLLLSIVIMILSGGVPIRGAVTSWLTERKKPLIIALISVVAAMLIVSSNRNGTIAAAIVTYFSGSLSFLDLIVSNPNMFALSDHLYGYLTFGAVTEPVVLIMKVLGLTNAKVPSYCFNIYCQSYYNISDGTAFVEFNNNTTALYYFMRDFGAFGVVIGALFLGLLVASFYNKWQSGSSISCLLFVYLSMVSMTTIMTYQLFAYGPLFAFFVFYFCTRKPKKSGKGSKRWLK